MVEKNKVTKTNKKQRWTRYRHRVVRNIANFILTPYAYFKYGMRIKRFKEKPRRQYLVLYNHQTAFDQFFVGMAFKGATYYVANDDLFTHGIVSSFIRWAVNPIPIKKQANDFKAVLNCKRVAKEGGTIALSPEGNRTYSGETIYIKPSIVGLVRILKLPIAFFKIDGGYGAQPRWSDVVRHGKMTAGVSKILEYEDYKDLSDDELYEIIKKEMYVNEGRLTSEYKHKKLAEHLERCMYVCPHCGLSEFESKNDIVKCKHCGMEIKYLPTKQLKGINKPFPFQFVKDWFDYQNNFVENLDISKLTGEIYSDNVKISLIKSYVGHTLLDKNGKVKLFNNRMEIVVNGKAEEMSFEDISVITVLGRNKLNIYWKDKVIQFFGGKKFNPIKYMNIYYRYKEMNDEGGDYGILGL